MYYDEIHNVINKIKVFDKMYEIIRFVDPIHKRIVNYKNNSIKEIDIKYFNYWEKNKICDNCISIRAFNENETFVKVEYSRGKTYMITAMPFELSDRRIVIEMFKDITNNIILRTCEDKNKKECEIYTVIDNMNTLVLKDDLTGVYNRRYINEKLPIDLISASILQEELSIIITDIDFFKEVNDTYGHVVGDLILKSFAAALKKCIKNENHWIARYGGEEFLISLPDTGIKKAVEIAEYMRKLIERNEIISSENIIKITSSFGVYSIRPDKCDSMEDLIHNADKKLYLAKHNGRNRVEY